MELSLPRQAGEALPVVRSLPGGTLQENGLLSTSSGTRAGPNLAPDCVKSRFFENTV
jgi:hypothetical protein